MVRSWEDLVKHILSVLPIANLCRCNAVSKDWRRRWVPCALPLRPTKLALLHLDNFSRLCIISDVTNGGHLIRFNNTSSNNVVFKFLGACNGMALFRTEIRESNPFPDPRHRIESYLVYNPVSHLVSVIDLPPDQRLYYGFHFMVFDRRLCFNQFMIVFWKISWDNNKAGRAYLYSSKTSEWRDLGLLSELLPYKTIADNLTDSYCLNGMAYKIVGDCDGANYLRKSIMVVEVENERIFFITSPVVPREKISTLSKDDYNGHRHHVLGEFGGCLGYAYYDRRSFNLLTWVMKSGGVGEDEWVLRHSINLNSYFADPSTGWSKNMVSFAFHPNSGDLLLVNISGHLFTFNLKTKELQQIVIHRLHQKTIYGDYLHHLSHHTLLNPFLCT